jgi:hypothetical protein
MGESRTVNKMKQADQFRLAKFIENLGAKEVASVTRPQILEIVKQQNFGFDVTEANLIGVLRILGFKTARSVSAQKAADTQKASGIAAVAQHIRFLKREVADLKAVVTDLSEKIQKLVENLS